MIYSPISDKLAIAGLQHDHSDLKVPYIAVFQDQYYMWEKQLNVFTSEFIEIAFCPQGQRIAALTNQNILMTFEANGTKSYQQSIDQRIYAFVLGTSHIYYITSSVQNQVNLYSINEHTLEINTIYQSKSYDYLNSLALAQGDQKKQFFIFTQHDHNILTILNIVGDHFQNLVNLTGQFDQIKQKISNNCMIIVIQKSGQLREYIIKKDGFQRYSAYSTYRDILDIQIINNNEAYVMWAAEDSSIIIEILNCDFQENLLTIKRFQRPSNMKSIFSTITSIKTINYVEISQMNEQIIIQSNSLIENPINYHNEILYQSQMPTLSLNQEAIKEQTIPKRNLQYILTDTYTFPYTEGINTVFTYWQIIHCINFAQKRPLSQSISGNYPSTFLGRSFDGNCGSNGIISGLPPKGEGGKSYTWGYDVTDGDGILIQSMTVIINVAVNAPPVFTSIADQSVKQGRTISVTPSASDSNTGIGDVVTITAPTLVSSVTFDGKTFTIAPTQATAPGTQSQSVTATDSALNAITTVFAINIIEDKSPVFSSTPVAQSVVLNSVLTYTLPTYYDPELQPVTLSLTSLPFASYNAGTRTFTFSPNQMSHVGVYSIIATLNDGFWDTFEIFGVEVTNTAPYYTSVVPVAQECKAYYVCPYTLPTATQDDEGNIIYTQISGMPAFVTFTSNTFTFSPNSNSQVGIYPIVVTLTDTDKGTPYNLVLTVIENLAPAFTKAITPLTMKMNDVTKITLSDFADPELKTSTFQGIAPLALFGFGTFSVTGVSGSTGEFIFSPTTFAQVGGPYDITITLIDFDTVIGNIIQSVTVTNSPPYLKTAPPTQAIAMNSVLTYTLTDYVDDESNPISISAVIQGTASLPAAYISYTFPTFVFTPTQFSEVGDHVIELTLSDTQLMKVVLMTLSVTNLPPIFDSALPVDQECSLNEVKQYQIPKYHDPEGSPVTVTQSPAAYISVLAGGLLQFQPVLFGDVGIHTITISLADGMPAKTDYTFQLKVINMPPLFTAAGPEDLIIPYNTLRVYKLPAYHDPERHAITVSFLPLEPSVVSLTGDTFTFKITSYSLLGDHLYTVHLNDGQPAYTDTSFKVTFYNDPPIFTSIAPETQTVSLNEVKSYFLPPFHDPEGDNASITIAMVTDQKYISLTGSKLSFYPNAFSQLGTHEIKIILSDGEPKSKTYMMNVIVINSAPYFVGGVKTEIKMRLNEQLVYTLPPVIDKEKHQIFYESEHPIFAEFQDGSYIIKPTLLDQIGLFTISGLVRDEVDSTFYSIKLKVINDPPFFFTPLIDQLAYVGVNLTYELPFIIEREMLEIKMTTTLIANDPLPYFIAMEDGVLKVNATDKRRHIGVYILQYILQDTISEPRFYFLKVKVENLVLNYTDEEELIYTKPTEETNIEQYFNSSQWKQRKSTIIAKAYIRLTQASRDGLVKMKISSYRDIRGVINQIYASDFIINIITKENARVPFEIIGKDNSTGMVTIILKFNDSTQISDTADLDIIRATFVNDVIFDQGYSIVYIPKKRISDIKLPPQASNGQMKFGNGFAKTFNYMKYIVIPASIILKLLLSICIQYLWGLMNDMSFLTMMAMLPLTTPGVSQMIQKTILDFIYFDVFLTDEWLEPLFFPETSEDDDIALNEQFSDNGFQASTMIKNLGSTFIYILVYFAGFAILLLMQGYQKIKQKWYKQSKPKIVDNWISRHLIWNGSIRFLVQQAAPLAISSFINLQSMKFNHPGMGVSSILAIIFTMILPVSIVLMLFTIRKAQTQNTFKSQEFQNQFGTLFEGLNSKNGFISTNWTVFILIRFLFTSAILVTQRDELVTQIFIFLCLSVFWQCLIIYGQPMKNKLENRMSLINEVMVSLYLYIALNLADFQTPNTLREEMGLALTCVVILNIIINFGKFLGIVFYFGVKKCQAKIAKYKEKKQLRHQTETQKLKLPNLQNSVQINKTDFLQTEKFSFSDQNENTLIHLKTAQSRHIKPRELTLLEKWQQGLEPVKEPDVNYKLTVFTPYQIEYKNKVQEEIRQPSPFKPIVYKPTHLKIPLDVLLDGEKGI